MLAKSYCLSLCSVTALYFEIQCVMGRGEEVEIHVRIFCVMYVVSLGKKKKRKCLKYLNKLLHAYFQGLKVINSWKHLALYRALCTLPRESVARIWVLQGCKESQGLFIGVTDFSPKVSVAQQSSAWG